MTYLALLSGLVLLVVGGELLVRGAVRLAAGWGVSPLVIGLTVVAFGTSMPELVTSVQASLNGAPGIALGNIVGSNVANILLIVGISALVYPIRVQAAALKRDGAVMLGVAVAFAALAAITPLSRPVGAAYVLALAAYVVFVIRAERTAPDANHGAVHDKAVALENVDPAVLPVTGMAGGTWGALLLCLAGLGLLVFGGQLLVSGAVTLAQRLGVSDAVIGLTVVAVGTSLPELVTSVIAAVRKQADVAFGNVVGSNICNILGIGGVTGLLAPLTVPAQIVSFDNPVMVVASVALLVFAHTGARIGRREGALLLSAYGGYVWLIWGTSALTTP